MSDISWSDIAYEERHGYLPDKGSTMDELVEYYGENADPDEVLEIENLVAEKRLSQKLRVEREEVQRLRDLLDEHGIEW